MKVPYIFCCGLFERLYAPVAQLDRALACGARGRKFESCRVYQFNLRMGMNFIKYVKYSGLGIIAICSTAIAILAGAEFFELILGMKLVSG